MGGLRPDSFDPVPDGLRDELWAIVRPDVSWHAAQDEKVRQSVNDFSGVQLAFYTDRQTFLSWPPKTVPLFVD